MKRITANLIKVILITIVLGLIPLGVSAQEAPSPVCLNNPQATLCQTCLNNPQATLCQDDQTTRNPSSSNSIFGPNGVVNKAAGIIALVTGIASVVMIIIGAIQYAISGGDPARLNRAKDTILFALIGLTIALLARLIISFVLNKL